jgi:hypothetical protein
MKIAHLINVTEITDAKKSSYLHIAQPVTLATMLAAQKNAAPAEIELLAVKHQAEQVSLPAGFRFAPDLDRYAWEVLDSLSALSFRRPLPLLQDILARFYETSDADYFIFTNLDIGLMPNFYIRVSQLIEQGHDALYINRRDLPKENAGIQIDHHTLDHAYTLEGLKHPGLDCFVFKRNILPALNVGNVFVGYPPLGQVLKTQIDRHSQDPIWITDEKLTFHLGRDKRWNKNDDPYYVENLKQAQGLYVDQFSARKPKFYRGIVKKIKALLGIPSKY